MSQNIRKEFKFIVIGCAGTGKTSLVNKFTRNEFNEKYRATVVSEFGFKIVNYDGVQYRIQIWDLAGQDKNATITKIFAKDAHGVLVVADSTNNSTLQE
ncbi:MAG: GTP-binding protein [archaeon]|nr:GTP-binding protein [archaeon]